MSSLDPWGRNKEAIFKVLSFGEDYSSYDFIFKGIHEGLRRLGEAHRKLLTNPVLQRMF